METLAVGMEATVVAVELLEEADALDNPPFLLP